jgi:nucleoside-diphosphate-sugar epimerase
MKVSILGGTGFVGSALGRFLRESGGKVVSLGRPSFDLTRPETYRLIPADTEVLVHAAGHVGETTDEGLLWKTNVESTYGLIRHINGFGQLRLVVYLSSGAVYGMQEGELTCNSPLRPESLYGVTKMLSERMIETMLRAQPVIVRLFFPFGPGQRPPRFIPRLIQRLSRGETVDLARGTDGPVVNPVFGEDLVVGLDRIIKSPEKSHYNLGGSERRTVGEIARAIAFHFGIELRVTDSGNETGNLFCRSDLPFCEDFDRQLAETIRKADYL